MFKFENDCEVWMIVFTVYLYGRHGLVKEKT